MPEQSDAETILYYGPRTRSFTALWMLEELGGALHYRLHSFDVQSGEQRKPEHLARNPMGKVPVLWHDGQYVAELGAIGIYLADKFPAAGMGPDINHKDRAAFLRWCFFSSAIVEPALGEKFFKWDVPSGSVAWGSFERMMRALNEGLEGREWLVGDSFSFADVLVGSGVRFGTMFGAIDKTDLLMGYVERLQARAAFARAQAIEKREGERFPPAS